MGQALSINNPAGTVSNLDSSGNAAFTGNITIGKTASVLIPQPNTVTLYSPDGTSVSMIDPAGNKTQVSGGAAGTTLPSLTVAGVPVPATTFQESDHSLMAWTYDPILTFSGTNSVSGTVYLAKVNLRYPALISTVWISISSAAVGVTANQNFLGIYNSAGTRVAVTAAGAIDVGIASSGVFSANVATPVTLPAGFYWVAFVNNATTPAQLGRATTLQSTPNANLTAATLRVAVNGTGQTSLPASITPSANSTTNAISYWAAID